MGYQEQGTPTGRGWMQRAARDGGHRYRHGGHLVLEQPLGKAAEREILGQAGPVRRRAQAARAAALPTPSLFFFPGFNWDPMIKFPLPGVGSSCARTSSAGEGDGVYRRGEVKAGAGSRGGCESPRSQTPSRVSAGAPRSHPALSPASFSERKRNEPYNHFKAPLGARFCCIVLGGLGFIKGKLPAAG